MSMCTLRAVVWFSVVKVCSLYRRVFCFRSDFFIAEKTLVREDELSNLTALESLARFAPSLTVFSLSAFKVRLITSW